MFFLHLVFFDRHTMLSPTYIHTCTPTYIPTYRHTCTPTYIPTYIHTCTPTYIPTYLHTDIQTYRHTDTQTYRHTDIQTHRHTDTQTYRHTDNGSICVLYFQLKSNYVYVCRSCHVIHSRQNSSVQHLCLFDVAHRGTLSRTKVLG